MNLNNYLSPRHVRKTQVSSSFQYRAILYSTLLFIACTIDISDNHTYCYLCLLMLSADMITFSNNVGPSGSKLYDTLMVFLKEVFRKDDFEKN